MPSRLRPLVPLVLLALLLGFHREVRAENLRLVAPPMKDHDTGLRLLCPLCQRPCASQKELVDHVRYDHPALRCPDCDLRCATPEALREHRLRHHRKGVFVCPDCGTVFPDEELLKAHRVDAHGGAASSRSWLCRICGRDFPTRGELVAHRERVHPAAAPARPAETTTVTKCPWCERRFPEGRVMDDHVRRKHPEHWTRRVRCPICQRFFPNGESLEVHLKAAHGDLPGVHRRRCPRCQKLLLPDEWEGHMRTHAPKAR